jgi:hypothetical protein
MVKRSAWSNRRLSILFDAYRLKFWPSRRRLKSFRIEIATLDDAYGRCDFERKILLINVDAHPSDRELRATVLHEMVHAVVGRGGHDAAFWQELEYLLSRCAPITIGLPELGERGGSLGIIPRRFRRCRRLFRPVFQRQQRELKRRFTGIRTRQLTPLLFGGEMEDLAALNNVSWRRAWAVKAREFDMVDLDGRVVEWAKRYRTAARAAYVRGRRFFRDDERRLRFESLKKGGA